VPSDAPSITTSITHSRTSQKIPKTNVWRELVVSVTPEGSTHSSLSTPTSQRSSNPTPPEFQLTISKSPNALSVYLPETSPRYQALKQNTGAIIEISPESLIHAADFATRIGGSTSTSLVSSNEGTLTKDLSTKQTTKPFRKTKPSGAALIIDYGPSNNIPTNSLRGIRSHKVVSPFTSPGLVDISADVDFTGLAHAAVDASMGVEVHMPIEQAAWLTNMGIHTRAEILKNAAKDEEARKRIEGSLKRLVDRGPIGMGKIYKVMAITPLTDCEGPKRKPPGFKSMM
jgi:NADH dehydrogenase [ubiquinone] 1 alpha subcomplex assembly factor 7